MRADARRPRPLRVAAIAWAAFALLSALWSFATPNSASPDEPAHIIKAGSVVRGEFLGPETSTGMIVHVPRYLAWTQAQPCYAFADEESAACSPPIPGDPAEIVESRTMAGLYNPVYYLAVGWPTLLADDVQGIYAMRILSGVLSGLLVGAAAGLIATWRRPAIPLLALGIATTPMMLFLGGVVNPNAIEVTSVLAVVAGMLTLVLEPGRTSFRTPALVVLAAGALAVNMRGFSPLWVLLAIALPLLLVPWAEALRILRHRWTIIAAVAIGASTAFAVGWLLLSGTLTASTEEGDAQLLFPGAGQPFHAGVLWVLQRTFGFGEQMIGLFGWMDTPAPTAVLFVWTTLIGALVLAAGAALRGRALLVVCAQAAALVLVPAVIQGLYVTSGGYIWQGRYALPLLASLLLTAAALVARRVDARSSAIVRVVIIAIAGMAMAHAWALIEVLKRYVVGVDGSWVQFVRAPEWSPPGGVIPLCLVAIAAFAAAGAVSAAGIVRAARAGDPPEPGDVDRDARERAEPQREHDAV